MDGEDKLGKGRWVFSRVLIAAISSGLALGVGTIGWLHFRTSSRLVYQGKSLSAWLDTYDSSHSFGRGSSQWNEADNAVRHIGTNAVPDLVRRLRSTDSRFQVWFVALAQKQKFVRVRFVPAGVRNLEASRAFIALGDAGRGAVPELIRIYERSDSLDSRCAVIESLGWIGPASAPAVPTILQAMTNANNRLRGNAAWALGEVRAAPDSCVPWLTRALGDSDAWVRVSAAHALGNYGADAQTAIPALEQLLSLPVPPSKPTSSGVQVRLEVRRAIERIRQGGNSSEGIPGLSLPAWGPTE